MRISDWSSDVCSSDLRRNAGPDQRADIGAAMCFVLPRHDSEGRQRGSDPFRKLARALGKLEIDSPDAVGAESGFERDGMLLLAVPVEIGQAGRAACRERDGHDV